MIYNFDDKNVEVKFEMTACDAAQSRSAHFYSIFDRANSTA